MVVRRDYRVRVVARRVAFVATLWVPLGWAGDDRGFSLQWHPTSGCDGAGVRDGVAELLGASPEAVASPPLHARVRLRRQPTSWVVTVQVARGEARSTRVLEVGSCAEAVDAAALILALAIDPNVQSRSKAAEAAVARFADVPAAAPAEPWSVTPLQPEMPSSSGASGVEHPVPHSAQPAAPAPTEWSFVRWPMSVWLSAMGVVSVGALPSASPGTALEAGFGLGRLRFSAGGSRYAERTAARPNTTATITADLWSVDLRGGWRIEPAARWALVPSALFEWGQFSGRGNHVDRGLDERVPWAAAGLGATLGFRLLGRWFVAGGGDVLFALQRTRFTLNEQDFHRPAGVVGAARLGITFELEEKP